MQHFLPSFRVNHSHIYNLPAVGVAYAQFPVSFLCAAHFISAAISLSSARPKRNSFAVDKRAKDWLAEGRGLHWVGQLAGGCGTYE